MPVHAQFNPSVGYSKGMSDSDFHEALKVNGQLQHIGYTYMGHNYGQCGHDHLDESEWRGVFKFFGQRILLVVVQFRQDFEYHNEPVHNELERLVKFLWADEGGPTQGSEDEIAIWSTFPLEEVDRRLNVLCQALPLLEANDKRVSVLEGYFAVVIVY